MSSVGNGILTFILSMLASIFSCSTSFLACAMLAVLLLAIGVLGGFFRHTKKENKEEECIREFRSCQMYRFIITEGSSLLPLQSSTASSCQADRNMGLLSQLPHLLPFHPYLGGKRKDVTKSVVIRYAAMLIKQVIKIISL